MSQDNFNDSEKSALDILQEINSGLRDPRSLDKYTRQLCVEFLSAEGYTQSQIAQILKCSEKTIFRDLKEIRQRNELAPSIEAARQFVGDVFKKAMNHHDYLTRLARAKETPSAIKTVSELGAWKVLKELIEKMQSLGYLPLMPQQVIGDIFHHSSADGGSESLDEAKKMLFEIEAVAQETDTMTPDLQEDIKTLRGRIENAEIVSKAEKIKEKQKGESNNQEEGHGTQCS
jgi:transposase